MEHLRTHLPSIAHNPQLAGSFRIPGRIGPNNPAENRNHHRHRILLPTAVAVVVDLHRRYWSHHSFDCNIIRITRYIINFDKISQFLDIIK